MTEFKIEQAFNNFVGDKLWKPHNRKVQATIFVSTNGSGVLVNFDQKEGENILPISIDEFLQINNINQSDFYNG